MRRILTFFVLMLVFAPVAVSADPPAIGGCQIFPEDNPWNSDISNAPVHPNSAKYIKYINKTGGDNLHPDFGGVPSDWYGIPWVTATSATPLVPLTFEFDDESDPGPYPIPAGAPIEGGPEAPSDTDRHILVVETTNCLLYEVYNANPDGGGYNAGSGAIFDLSSNDLRPEGWTSADAAGLPILPGLARCDEANSGSIDHALRFTVSSTQRAFIYPATHFASDITNVNAPPLGLRLRLKAGYNLSGFSGQSLAIAQALKQYGMILADNGSNWFISGEDNQDSCWNNSNLQQLKSIPGTAFEVIVSPPPPSDVEDDRVRNGSFEAGLTDGTKPSHWTLAAHNDRRLCSASIEISGIGTTGAANSGRCAYQFKGRAAGDADYILQPVGMTVAESGLPIDIRLYAAMSDAPAGAARMKLKAKYRSGGASSEVVSLGSGSQDYTEILHTFTDTVNLKKLKITIYYSGTSGFLWVDDVSAVVSAGRSVLPLPPPN